MGGREVSSLGRDEAEHIAPTPYCHRPPGEGRDSDVMGVGRAQRWGWQDVGTEPATDRGQP